MRAKPRAPLAEPFKDFDKPRWWWPSWLAAAHRTRTEDRHIPELEIFFGRILTATESAKIRRQLSACFKRVYSNENMEKLMSPSPHPFWALIKKDRLE